MVRSFLSVMIMALILTSFVLHACIGPSKARTETTTTKYNKHGKVVSKNTTTRF